LGEGDAVLTFLVLHGALGCAEPRYTLGIEAACQGQEISDSVGVQQLLAELDPGCAAALAAPVGLEMSLDPESTEGWLLAGLYLLWAERSVELASDMGHPDMPELGLEGMAEAVNAQDLDLWGPAGEGWVAYVAQSVQETRVEDLDGALARYGNGAVVVDTAFPESFALVDISHPIGPAMIWVHEASHRSSGHERCAGERFWEAPDCDATEDGAYGMAAFFLRRWMGRHPDGLRVDCKEVVAFARCRLINEISEGWPVCEELAPRCL
jgi:hypothetical protein